MNKVLLALFWSIVAIWFAVIITSCAPILPRGRSNVTFPRQDEAVHVVWTEMYGRSDKPPVVVWVRVDPVTGCSEKGGDIGWETSWGECVGGMTLSGDTVYSVEPAGGLFSYTALSHELRHAALFRDHAPLPHHTEGIFQAPSERNQSFYDAVDNANDLLESRGM